MSTRQATVEDAPSSPSPPPPSTSADKPKVNDDNDDAKDISHEAVGPDGPEMESPAAPATKEDRGQEEEEEDVWDPSEERLPGQDFKDKKSKGKEKETDSPAGIGTEDQPWQAVWAPEQNAWYFWNTKTGEVSWTNPLESTSASETHAAQPPLPDEAPPLPSGPVPSGSTTTPRYGSAAATNAFEAPLSTSRYGQQPSQPEIDEGLLHMVSGVRGGGGYAPGGDPGVQSAAFNSRTGQFTPSNYQYTVGHLDEYNRAKRMNSHYFDVEAWEREKAADQEKRKREEESGQGGSRKVTKKDMQRFKKKAQEKRARNQAWLRD
ncbi:hypothetical protein I316_06736 [Kwoniella heveanensis BCC8398]|uniref:WW domain-containing protein n=1 Tax=Kwoniella heveanensis BCC8398 TaxID=1296120 RepID=A0A1B9GKM0_9TREE|nr:hypothetical protein I316_06736 [Kwoniella heveanensis BCC8398]